MNTASAGFALLYAGDAYSTDAKIMGRQSAGKSFIRGMARQWPQGVITGVGYSEADRQRLQAQLAASAFKGQVQWNALPGFDRVEAEGVLYYPGPPSFEFATARSRMGSRRFSLMGVTHTLATHRVLDEIAAMVLHPYESWDALICTSAAARRMVEQLQQECRAYWHHHTGAQRFVQVQLPVIPLGINVDDFARGDGAAAARARQEARQALGLREHDVAFLFAGRLSYHAKAHPAPGYQALQAAAQALRQQTPAERGPDGPALVCIEAGVFPNDAIREQVRRAQAALAPSVRFIAVDGRQEDAYRQSWRAADVFMSLADNIQETFGLTPVEAMAAGLPVVVSDWDGYRDTVRHGVDGIRVPTVIAPPGVGDEIALRHALGQETYDRYIGRASMATVVEPRALTQAIVLLATSAARRLEMAQAGQIRARQVFDWSVVLPQYRALAQELQARRRADAPQETDPTPIVAPEGTAWAASPTRRDPFHLFSGFASAVIDARWSVSAAAGAAQGLKLMLSLEMCRYVVDEQVLPASTLERLLDTAIRTGPQPAQALLESAQCATPHGLRALMWLWKFDLLRVNAASA